MILENLPEFIKQSPIIPLMLSVLLLIIVLLQCMTKHIFYKVRLIFAFLLTFASALFLIFFDELKGWIEKSNGEINIRGYSIYLSFILIEVAVCVLLFFTIDFSLSNDKLNKELSKNINATKYYVLLDKKDRIKDISEMLLKDLKIEYKNVIHKNFFDVIELKYRIIGMNGEEAYKKDLKKYFEHYERKVKSGDINKFELDIEDENAVKSAIYFNESVVFSNDKYKGRILLGDKKNENTLMGVERDLEQKSNELDLIKSRFLSIIGKTTDGIFFNNLTNKSIWFNDVLVKKLLLNGNSIQANDFYNNIAPEDLALYKETMANLKGTDYEITYKYNTGAYSVYIKEKGYKIITENEVELSGVMQVVDDYGYEKTETNLDGIKTEVNMLSKLNELLASESVFEAVYIRMDNIPTINENYSRAVANNMMSQYASFFLRNYVDDNMLYRIGGLDFICFITNYNKMEKLKANLRDNEKILHPSCDFGKGKVIMDVYLGISFSNDTPIKKEIINNAKKALKVSLNAQYQSSYAYFKDIN